MVPRGPDVQKTSSNEIHTGLGEPGEMRNLLEYTRRDLECEDCQNNMKRAWTEPSPKH